MLNNNDDFRHPFPGESWVSLQDIRKEIYRIEGIVDGLYDKIAKDDKLDERVIKKMEEDLQFNEGKIAGLKFALGIGDKYDSYNINDDTLAITSKIPVNEYIADANGYISTKELVSPGSSAGYLIKTNNKLPEISYNVIKYK